MSNTYNASIDPRFLLKVDRVFDAAPTTVWNELLQNARRAGATEVAVSFHNLDPDENGYLVSFDDNGKGIGSPALLLALAAEGWDAETEATEDPAGMGFFCMSNFEEVEVISRYWTGKFTPEVFRGQASMTASPFEPEYEGTTIKWEWKGKGLEELRSALQKAGRYCGMTVTINYPGGNEVIEPKNYLVGCQCVEDFGDWSIGIERGDSARAETYISPLSGPTVYVNFMGVRLSLLPDSIADKTTAGLKDLKGLQISIRVDVTNTSKLQLVLPARNAIKHNEARDRLARMCEKKVYDWVAEHKKGGHSLPFKVYKRARDEFGVDIGEAKRELVPAYNGWLSARPLQDTENAVLMASNVRCYRRHTELFNHATSRGIHSMVPYETDTGLEGYSWYDEMPVVSKVEIAVDGAPVPDHDHFVETVGGSHGRFRMVETLVVTFSVDGIGGDVTFDAPAVMLGDGLHAYFDGCNEDEDILFVVAKSSGDSRSSLSIASDMLARTAFEADSDSEHTSIEDQKDDFEDQLYSAMLGLFFGRREALEFQLIRALRHIPEVCRDADCAWTIMFNGNAVGRRGPVSVTSFNVGHEAECSNHKLVALIAKDGEDMVYEMTSKGELTRERLERYMEVEHGYDGSDDGGDFIAHDPVGMPIDLDEWENEQSKGVSDV